MNYDKRWQSQSVASEQGKLLPGLLVPKQEKDLYNIYVLAAEWNLHPKKQDNYDSSPHHPIVFLFDYSDWYHDYFCVYIYITLQ